MKCTECGGKGWTETHVGGGASWTPMLSQCKHRCNISGYSDEVQRRLNDKSHVTERPVLRSAPPQPVRQGTIVDLHAWRDDGNSH